VSVIDRFSGRPVLDLYVVADTGGEWIALRPDGRFYASDDRLASGQYLSVTREDVQLETRRLALDARSRSDASEDQPMHRFESGRDEENVEETEQFDPFSGDPAPSS
jgi:hypothetical protein